MPKYLTYDNFVTRPVSPTSTIMPAVLSKILKYYIDTDNTGALLKVVREAAGISYKQQLNTMLCSKVLFTGNVFYYRLSELGLQVAHKLLRYDFINMEVVAPAGSQLQSTHITTNQVKSIAQGKVWSALPSSEYDKVPGWIMKNVKILFEEKITQAELEAYIGLLISGYESMVKKVSA